MKGCYLNIAILFAFLLLGGIYSYKINQPKDRYIDRSTMPCRSYDISPIPAKIDWQLFIGLNKSLVISFGQKTIIPIEITDKNNLPDIENSRVKFEFGGTFGNFDKENIADISESISIEKINEIPVRILLPLTVKDEGRFYLNIYLVNGNNSLFLDKQIWVFAFDGKVAFSDSFPEEVFIKEKLIGADITQERLQEDVNKLKQRYFDKYGV